MIVEVLLSTYNGGNYIANQIISIIHQEKVETRLLIRDDGSTDNTVEIISTIQTRYKNRIRLIEGKNIGFKKSFLHLLGMAGEADYYCFSDQDDIWYSNKIIEAVNLLSEQSEPVCLYVSNLTLVNSNLNYLKTTRIQNVPCTLQGVFTRNRYAGCSFVFTRELQKIAARFSELDYPDYEMPEHDLIVAAIALACGTVIKDNHSYILHIRRKESLTGGSGVYKRIRLEYKNLFVKKHIKQNLASEIINRCSGELKCNERTFLESICSYRMSFKRKTALLFSKNMNCGNIIGNMECKIKIMMGTF